MMAMEAYNIRVEAFIADRDGAGAEESHDEAEG